MLFERLLSIISILGIVFLGILLGAVGVQYNVPGADYFKQVFTGIEAWQERESAIQEELKQPLAGPARVTIHKSANDKGYVAISFKGQQAVELYDMKGTLVHTWEVPFRQIFREHNHVKHPVPDALIFFHDFYLYPNGDLLGIYNGEGDFPFGYGIVKVDKHSRLIWKYEASVHHYLDVDEATGNIYVLSHEFSDRPIPNIPISSFPIVRDYLEILSPDGKPLKKISLLDALARSPYADYILSNGAAKDLLHCNQVFLVRDKVPLKASFMKAGQVLVSSRDTNSIMLVDPTSETVVHLWNGPWAKQHNAQLLQNGNILLFNNQFIHLPKGKTNSQILEFDPATNLPVWSFAGSDGPSFYSAFAGTVHQLANGNYIVGLTSHGGRVFEVTPDKRIVWQMDKDFVHQARYYADGQLLFLPSLHQNETPVSY